MRDHFLAPQLFARGCVLGQDNAVHIMLLGKFRDDFGRRAMTHDAFNFAQLTADVRQGAFDLSAGFILIAKGQVA